MILTITLLTSCIKLLLIPAYKSTDFEVHRNWLAITHKLPLKKWYYVTTSEWTLDYPPLFAFFEYFLSFFAQFFDREMLNVYNLNYDSKATILYQRLSVIVTDLIYVYGSYKCCNTLPKGWKTQVVLPILLITNCGLLMVDHVHFQYNGIMYGLLLISVAYVLEGRHLWAAFWFTILLNMKHIYIYLAPAYFIFLLRNYCVGNSKSNFSISALKRLALLGSLVILVFLLVFAPFYDQLGQIFSRLFPFKRGLCHAYWAPNVWALYNTVDKVASAVLSKVGFRPKVEVGAMTGGLVKEFSHSVLPTISPLATMLLTVLMMVPGMVKLWFLNKPMHFLRFLVICALTAFLFGWHVHEKAILMAIIPLSLLSVYHSMDAKTFLLLEITGHYSLFPLLFPGNLLFVKVLLLILYTSYAFHSLSKIYPIYGGLLRRIALPLLNRWESAYILGFGLLFVYENVIHELGGHKDKFPFLGLMLTSVYCSIGVVYCWMSYYYYFLRLPHLNYSNKAKKG